MARPPADRLGDRGRRARAGAAAAGHAARPLRRHADRPLRRCGSSRSATEIGQLLIAATLAALTLGGWIQVWQIYALALLQGIGQSIGGPARHALVFQMVGPDDLANAVGLNSSLGTTARVVGPAIGGAIVALRGRRRRVRGQLRRPSSPRSSRCSLIDVSKLHLPLKDHGATLVGGALDALRFVVHNTRAGVAFFGVLVISTFAFNLNVLFPLLAKQTLDGGAGTFGLIAAVLRRGRARRRPGRRRRRGSNSLQVPARRRVLLRRARADPRAADVDRRRLRAAVPDRASVTSQWGATALTAIQLEAPEHLRGRAASLYFWAFLGGAPIGGLFAGWLVVGRRDRARVRRRRHDRRDDRRRGDGAAAPRERPLARERAGAGVADGGRDSGSRSSRRLNESMTSAHARRGSTVVREGAGVSVLRLRRHPHVRERAQAPQLPPLLLRARPCRSPATGCSRSRPRGSLLELTDSAVAVGALALAMLLPTTRARPLRRHGDRPLRRAADDDRLRGALGLIAAAFAVLTLGGWITVWEIYALAVHRRRGRRARRAGAARARLPDGRPEGPAERGRADVEPRHDGARARPRDRRLRRRVRRPGRRVRAQRRELPRRSSAACSRSTRSRLLHARRDSEATVLGGAADSLRFIGNSRRALVAFVAVFALSTSRSTSTCCCRSSPTARCTPAPGLRPDRRGVRSGRAVGAMINATVGRASLRLLLIGAAGFGFFELLLAPQHSLPIVCVLLFLTGITYTLWGTNALSTIQLEAPEHLRGRAAALYFFAFLGGAPLGGLLCGWLTAKGGTRARVRRCRRGRDRHRGWGIVRLRRTAPLRPQPLAQRATASAARATSSSPIPRWVTRRTSGRRAPARARRAPRSSAAAPRPGASGQDDVRLRRRRRRSAARARARGGGPRPAGRRCAERDEARPRRAMPALWIVPPPSRADVERARRRSSRRRPRAARRTARTGPCSGSARPCRPARRAPRAGRRARPRRSGAARRRGGRARRSAAPRRRAPRSRDVGHRAAGARVRVLEAEQRRARAPERASTRRVEPPAIAVDANGTSPRAPRCRRDSLVITCADARRRPTAPASPARAAPRGSPSCTSGRRRPPPCRAAPRRAARAR